MEEGSPATRCGKLRASRWRPAIGYVSACKRRCKRCSSAFDHAIPEVLQSMIEGITWARRSGART